MGGNELLFYGGIAAVVGALLLGTVLFIIFKVKWTHLNDQLNQEYGAMEKSSKHTRSK